LSAQLAIAKTRAKYRHLYPVLPSPSRLTPYAWAMARGTLQTAEGVTHYYRDVARPYQDSLLRDAARRVIVAKSRQIGISQVAAFIVATEMLNGGTALIISRDQGAAAEFLGYVRTALLGDPHAPAIATDNAYALELTRGGRAIAQSATRKAGRGIPATLVVLDEQAWQEYAELIWTAVLPTLATTEGRLLVLSTPNGYGNLFHRLWEEAQREGAGWSPHFLPWWHHPQWASEPDWAARKKDEDRLTDEQFAQEYDVDFARSGSAVFDPEQIKRMWRLQGFEPPQKNHRYVSGWDIARKQDAFVGFTIDISTAPFRVVAYERHLRMSYPDQAAAIEKRDRLYSGFVQDKDGKWVRPTDGPTPADRPQNMTWVESNGVGDPLIQFLNINVSEFTTTALTKRNAIDALLLLMQRDELISPLIPEWSRELLVYQRDDKNLMQDTVMAAAITALAAGRPVRKRTVEVLRGIG
jgi:hypothetical protein